MYEELFRLNQTRLVLKSTDYDPLLIGFNYKNIFIVFFFKVKEKTRFQSKDKNLLKYIIVTKLGSGPRCVNDHLLNNDGTLK